MKRAIQPSVFMVNKGTGSDKAARKSHVSSEVVGSRATGRPPLTVTPHSVLHAFREPGPWSADQPSRPDLGNHQSLRFVTRPFAK